MAVVMIGVDPHKASHTAVAINAAEEPLGQLEDGADAERTRRGPAHPGHPAPRRVILKSHLRKRRRAPPAG